MSTINNEKLEQASEFWEKFQASSAKLRDKFLANLSRDVFDYINKILLDSGYDLAFELTSDNQNNILLSFSPEGDKKLIQQINQLVAEKPTLVGWIIHKYIQPKPVQDAFLIIEDIFDIDLRDISFLILDVSERVSLRIFTKLLDNYETEDVQSVAKTFLWHILGEKFVTEKSFDVTAGGWSQTHHNSDLLCPRELVDKFSE